MPTLLSLPNELLDHIINDIHIDDIEAFSSCCKEIKVSTAVRLAEHLARKLNFSTVAIEPDPYDASDSVRNTLSTTALLRDLLMEEKKTLIPTRLLRDFLMDEKNTLYPRSMSIRDIEATPNGNERLRSELVTTYLAQHQGLEDKIAAKVMQIQKSLYTEMPAVESHDWIDRIMKGDSDATAAFLITLFPNVKTLKVVYCHAGSGSLFIRTLERLTSSIAYHGPRALGAFRELSEIDLRDSRSRGVCGNLIAAFMFLPSMRVIKGSRVHWSPRDAVYGPVASNVKEISLHSSLLGYKPFVSCIKRIQMLERFTCDLFQTRESHLICGPRLIVKALHNYAWRTLVHLELTGEMRIDLSSPTTCEPFIGTLRSFQVLESIRLMTMMLFKPVDGEDIDECKNIYQSTMEDLVHPDSLVEPRRLVDFLPASARKLALVGGISNEEAGDMFADLPKLRYERVPKLGEIVLEDSDPLEQDTKDLCKNAGIRLKSIKRVVNGYQRIYAITKPAPQVDCPEN